MFVALLWTCAAGEALAVEECEDDLCLLQVNQFLARPGDELLPASEGDEVSPTSEGDEESEDGEVSSDSDSHVLLETDSDDDLLGDGDDGDDGDEESEDEEPPQVSSAPVSESGDVLLQTDSDNHLLGDGDDGDAGDEESEGEEVVSAPVSESGDVLLEQSDFYPADEWEMLKAALVQGQSNTSYTEGRNTLRLTQAQKKALLDKHNELRRLEGAESMQKLVWSEEVAATAQKWADQCVWEHSTPTNVRKYAACNGGKCSSGGENLACTSASPDRYNPNSGVQAWYDEKSDWSYKDGRFVSNYCVPGRMCGHYTAVVWAASNVLGCALADCGSRMKVGGSTMRTYLVCQYKQAGNMMGGLMYKKGGACSKCPSGTTCCERGLCVSGTGGKLDQDVVVSSCDGSKPVTGKIGQGLNVAGHSMFKSLGPYLKVQDLAATPQGWVAKLKWKCSDASCSNGQGWPDMKVGRCEGRDWFKVEYKGTLPGAVGALRSQDTCPGDDGLGGSSAANPTPAKPSATQPRPKPTEKPTPTPAGQDMGNCDFVGRRRRSSSCSCRRRGGGEKGTVCGSNRQLQCKPGTSFNGSQCTAAAAQPTPKPTPKPAPKPAPASGGGNSGATICASAERRPCACTGTVVYGRKFAKGRPGNGKVNSLEETRRWAVKEKSVATSISCSNNVFGDPASTYAKHCFCIPSGSGGGSSGSGGSEAAGAMRDLTAPLQDVVKSMKEGAATLRRLADQQGPQRSNTPSPPSRSNTPAPPSRSSTGRGSRGSTRKPRRKRRRRRRSSSPRRRGAAR